MTDEFPGLLANVVMRLSLMMKAFALFQNPTVFRGKKKKKTASGNGGSYLPPRLEIMHLGRVLCPDKKSNLLFFFFSI